MDELASLWDDDTANPEREQAADHEWSEYLVEVTEAREHAVAALVGGNAIGHTCVTIQENLAEEFFERFVGLFDEPKQFYIRMGFGKSEYVYQYGVVVMDSTKAGILWVVESD